MKKSLVIPAAMCIAGVLFAVWPLFGRKYIPTHDGEYNIIRIVEFARMLRAGYWFPRWAPTLNSGYGVPVFEYYYPFPNYIGAAVSSIIHDAVRAFQMSEGIGYGVAALAVFGWLFSLFGLGAAAVGTMVGMFVPYWFVNMYVRGSLGEIWATAFLFVVLFVIEKKKYIFMAAAYALLILSHNILAMVYTPFIMIYAVIRDRKALWAMIGGVALSAYFWLPAILEQKYVVGLNTVNFREHFAQPYELLIPSWGTEFSGTGAMANKISFQVGIVSIMSIIAAACVRKEKDEGKRRLFIYFLAVVGISIIAMLSVSQPLWEIVKPIQFIQYPWRLLSFVIPTAAFMSGYWVSHMKKRWIGIVFAIVAVLLSSAYVHPVLYEPRNEAYYLARPNFTDGTVSMGNSFSTIWTGWKNVRPAAPYTIDNGRETYQTRWQYLEKDFAVSMDEAGTVTVNTLYFPGWIASVDRKEVPINYRQDGIILISVPQGPHVISVRFTDTPARRIGNTLSIVSVAVLAILGYTYQRKTT
jgi:uncharacterized membrane protein